MRKAAEAEAEEGEPVMTEQQGARTSGDPLPLG